LETNENTKDKESEKAKEIIENIDTVSADFFCPTKLICDGFTCGVNKTGVPPSKVVGDNE